MAPKPDHIYWFAPYNAKCPSTRYRGLYPMRHLAENEQTTYSFFYPSRTLKGIRKFLTTYFSILFFRKRNSTIVIQKVCSNSWYANALKLLVLLRGARTQFDIDDAEYLRQDTKTLHFFLKKCQLITVGSKALQDYCVRFNSNVKIITSPVIDHGQVKSQRNNLFHIGWVGDFGNGNEVSKDFSHKKSVFEILLPAVRKLDFPVKITFIGVQKKNDVIEIKKYFQDCEVELDVPSHLSWRNDSWIYTLISNFDVGVSPMVDHPFNQSKSAFKAKQYLSAGVPTIASNVGETNKFVGERNGFLCSTSEDFFEAITKVKNMNDVAYWELSNNARNSRHQFSMNRYCDELTSLHAQLSKSHKPEVVLSQG